MPKQAETNNGRISRLSDIFMAFFISIARILFFWLPDGDPLYGYVLLAIQAICMCLIIALFFALPFIRLIIAGFMLVVYIFKWIRGGCNISYAKEKLHNVYQSLTRPFINIFNVLFKKLPLFNIALENSETPLSISHILDTYGDWKIYSAYVRRDPITSMINKINNVFTFGKWSEIISDMSIEKVYHTSLLLRLKSKKNMAIVLIEKNAILNFNDFYETHASHELYKIKNMPRITLNQFVKNAQDSMEAQFYPYDALYNNCKTFIYEILAANLTLSKEAKDFIMQSLFHKKLIEKVPKESLTIGQTILQMAALFNTALQT